jgi:hypothetical protein
MKNYKNTITLVLSLLLFMVIKNLDTYTVGQDSNVEILDKIKTNAGYKVPARFLFIVKDNQGRVFHLNVSPSSYSQTKIGEHKTFNISEQDIGYSTKGFFIYVLPMLILLTSAGLSFVFILTNKFIEEF